MTWRVLSGFRFWMIRLCVSFAVMVALAVWLDVGEVANRLGRMQPAWVSAALLLSLVQVLVSAWRWRFTAGCLGIDLPFSVAVQEYYLAMFLNQVIPGGVVGDVSRAWRHARSQVVFTAARGPAVRAVILERASGQVVMGIVAGLSVLFLPLGIGLQWKFGIGATLIGVIGVGSWTFKRYGQDGSEMGALIRDARTALFTQKTFPLQFVVSVVVVSTYVVTFVIAAKTIGIETPFFVLLPLVSPVLVTMVIPVTIAGWGVREGFAAILWGSVGLAPVDGVPISVAYGLLVLLSTLPGSIVLAMGAKTTHFQAPD